MLAAPPPDPEDLARAEHLLERRDYAAAEKLLREILRADPKNAQAHGNLALAMLSQRKVREAVAEARLAAAFAPDMAEAHYIYGLTLRADANSLDAAREFARAVALRSDAIPALAALAEAYSSAGDERAVPVYERLIALEPKNRVHRRNYAEHFWNAGQPERGFAIASTALAEFPDDAELHARYGQALFEDQRFLDAADELARARELGMRDVGTLGLLGQALWQGGRMDAAVAAYESAVAAHPGSESLRLDQGRLLLAVGKNPEALSALEVAFRLAPQDAAASYQLGRAHEAVGSPGEAEAAYRRALALAPQLASPRYALGRLLVRQGRKEEGERELETYRGLYARAAQVQHETSSRSAEIQLAESELVRGDAAAALARFDALPESVDVLTGRARALARLNRHGEALRALERARDLQPDEPRIQALLAVERARAGNAP